MSRKRFVVSLTDDDLTNRLIGSHKQIIFTLTPLDVTGLYETTHPIVWETFEFCYSEPYEYQCTPDLAICRVMKTSNACIEHLQYRIVPAGHYVSLTLAGYSPVWTETRRWHKDVPDSIVISNHSKGDQWFALCSSLVEKGQHEPNISPILLYNKIPDGRNLLVKTRLVIQAYFGQNHQLKMQIKKDTLTPVLDSEGNPWSVLVEDLNIPMSCWKVKQLHSGDISMAQDDSDALGYKEPLRALQDHINTVDKNMKKALGVDFTAVGKIRQQVHELKTQLADTNQTVRHLRSEMDNQVAEMARPALGPSNTLNSMPLTNETKSLRTNIGTEDHSKSRFMMLYNELSDMSEHVNEIDHALAVLATETSRLASHVDANQHNDQLGAHLMAQKEEIKEIEERLKDIGKSMDDLRKGTSGLEERMEEEKKQVSSRMDDLSKHLKSKVGKWKHNTQALSKTIDTVRSDVTGLGSGLNTALESIGRTKETAEQQARRIEEIATDAVKTRDLEAVSHRINLEMEDFKKTSASAERTMLSTAIDGLQAQVDATENTLDEKMETVKRDVQTVQERTNTLEGTVHTLEGKTTAVTQEVGRFNVGMTAVERKIADKKVWSKDFWR